MITDYGLYHQYNWSHIPRWATSLQFSPNSAEATFGNNLYSSSYRAQAGVGGAAFTKNRRCMSSCSTNQCRNILLIKRSATRHTSDKHPDGNFAKFPKCFTCLQGDIAILYSDTQFREDSYIIPCQDGIKEYFGKNYSFPWKQKDTHAEQWICNCQSSSFFCTTPSPSNQGRGWRFDSTMCPHQSSTKRLRLSNIFVS